MSNSQLLEKHFNGGQQAPHYFNGRLLTADALEADHEAVRLRQDQLGKASGSGIIEGLVVRKVPTDATRVSITAGTGLNYAGHVLYLPDVVTLKPIAAAPEPISPPAVDTSKFNSRRAQSTPIAPPPTPDGVYLLTVIPATRYEGTVAMKASVGGVSSGTNNTPGCGSKWKVEGVQFKTIRLGGSDLKELFAPEDLTSVDVTKTRRNLLAHWCYGTVNLKQLGLDPFTFPDAYSGIDRQFIPDLTDDDLPLAVFHWDGSALTFVDSWSARRRVTHPDAQAGTASSASMGTWKALVDDLRVAANEARFRQFQDQLDGIIERGKTPGSGIDLTMVKATDYFTFLPPMGFLPVSQDRLKQLLCHAYDKNGTPFEHMGKGTDQTGDMGATLQGLSDPYLRMLGEFTGVALVSAAGVLVPGLGMLPALGAAGGIAGGIGRLFGGIFGSGRSIDTAGSLGALGSLQNASTQDLFGMVQQLSQQVADMNQRLGGTPAENLPTSEIIPTPPTPQVSPKQPTQKLPHVKFRDRICYTLSQQRTTAATSGFDLVTFFEHHLLRINLIGSDRIDVLMHQSWYENAIDLRPEQHPDPMNKGMQEYPVENGLHPMPLVFDIYLVEENLRDTSAPLYVIFQKGLHPIEFIRLYKEER
ncbi:MAG TPA: hypothetical protein VIY29_16155 [Ktedonobacteraceae bacterium]